MNTADEYRTDYVPLSLWGRDHWSMLAYFETVEVEKTYFPVVSNQRMRQNRRHYRVMPNRPAAAVPMLQEHGSRLNDGRYVPGHDDWNCVQDMANSGLLTCAPEFVEPNQRLRLSDLGHTIAAQLRKHRARVGNFSNFHPVLEEVS